MAIRKVAVIGAGVMGAGIAAHVANGGCPVMLLDIVPEGAANRNTIADEAVAGMLRRQPAAFMHQRNARLVTTGNIEDHLPLLGDCDWIIEAVIENLDIKRDLYQRIIPVRRADAIVSSNTSSIPLRDLIEGMPEGFASCFLITHFFNPPRYMRLLELVCGEQTNPKSASLVRDFADVTLGKGVVECRDTPGFIANRIGVYWVQTAIQEAMAGGLTVEEADAVIGPPVGVPKTGVFGLSDLVGIDIIPHLMAVLMRNLPADDPLLARAEIPQLIGKMIAEGNTGRKGKGGFYRRNQQGGRTVREAIDLASGAYRPVRKVDLASVAAAAKGGLAALLAHHDKGGAYAWRVLSQVLSYAAGLVPDIADDIVSVDQAMKLGYGWRFGPFELIDQIGCDLFVAHLAQQEMVVPELLRIAEGRSFYRTTHGKLQFLGTDGDYQALQPGQGMLQLADIKRCSEPIAGNDSASLWDVGDGVACLEFHSKMNALDPDILAMLREAVDIVPRKHRALVLYNEGSNYSVGANLGLLLFAARAGSWDQIEGLVGEGQRTFQALKYAPFPVVGAPSGMALGGGCETLLHCDALQAHAETYMGLVEVGVGLIPAWGGCKEMLSRWLENHQRPGGPMPAVLKCFELISTASVTKSAVEGRDLLLIRPHDGITMNRDRLLSDAKAKALALAADYQPSTFNDVRLPGPSARVTMKLAVGGFRRTGRATAHDQVVAEALAEVLSGGDTDITALLTEEDLHSLERASFMNLIRHPDTLARLAHMLETGKPLRN